jgi:hypothetical protein
MMLGVSSVSILACIRLKLADPELMADSMSSMFPAKAALVFLMYAVAVLEVRLSEFNTSREVLEMRPPTPTPPATIMLPVLTLVESVVAVVTMTPPA